MPADYDRLSSFQKSFVDSYAKRERTIEPVVYSGLGAGMPSEVDIGSGGQYFTIYQGGSNSDFTNAKNLFLRSCGSKADWDAARPCWEILLNK